MVIELPNGNSLIINENQTGERIVFIMQGLSIGAEILPANDEPHGSDAWANKEIELYEKALEIDLNSHRDYIKKCLANTQKVD